VVEKKVAGRETNNIRRKKKMTRQDRSGQVRTGQEDNEDIHDTNRIKALDMACITNREKYRHRHRHREHS
jgi:hypothetical protein